MAKSCSNPNHPALKSPFLVGVGNAMILGIWRPTPMGTERFIPIIARAVGGINQSPLTRSGVSPMDSRTNFRIPIGTGLQVYGAPYQEVERLGLVPGKQELCILGSCQEINTQELYDALDESERDAPILLWSYGNLPDRADHRLEVRLLDASSGQEPRSIMTIHHMVVKESPPRLPPSYKTHEEEDIVQTTYYDTNPWISYSPSTACQPVLFGCNRYNPWAKEVVAFPSGHNQSFHHTSTLEDDAYGANNRSISFTFQGVALYVYGASKAQVDRIGGDKDIELAHQSICIENSCEVIDAHQAYLNVDPENVHEPVLLWSYEGYPSTSLRHAELRLLDNHSPVGHVRHMTLDRFVVSEVKKRSSWAHPIAGAQYYNTKVNPISTSIRYGPRQDRADSDPLHPYSPWDVQFYSAPGGRQRLFMHTSTDHGPEPQLRTWNFTFTGYSMRVYGAPQPYLIHATHVKQEICLDGKCYPVDVEHAYMTVDPDFEREPVLLWSMEDIDVSRSHVLTMRVAESGQGAGEEIKGMTFAGLEYTKVVMPWWVWTTLGRPPTWGDASWIVAVWFVAWRIRQSSNRGRSPLPAPGNQTYYGSVNYPPTHATPPSYFSLSSFTTASTGWPDGRCMHTQAAPPPYSPSMERDRPGAPPQHVIFAHA
ncbi:hypothetical protein FRB98_007408 [Tulasnella sp. 332]|nr:hypothetical protein FRB98_007408 [Tulasnella sp. 332]